MLSVKEEVLFSKGSMCCHTWPGWAAFTVEGGGQGTMASPCSMAASLPKEEVGKFNVLVDIFLSTQGGAATSQTHELD